MCLYYRSLFEVFIFLDYKVDSGTVEFLPIFLISGMRLLNMTVLIIRLT